MKSFPRCFRLNELSSCCATVAAMLIILLFGCAFVPRVAAQQNNPEYQVNWIPTPIEMKGNYINAFTTANDANGVTDLAFIVGWRTLGTERQAYLYDHFGTLDPTKPQHFYVTEEPELGVLFPPTWLPDATGKVFRDVNSSGRIVGHLATADGTNVGFYLDLFPTDGNGNPIPREFKPIAPPFDAGNQFIGTDVNELGDILVASYESNESPFGRPYIFNPDTGEQTEIPVSSTNRIRLNLFRQIKGVRADNVVFRHTITAPDGSGTTETFPDLSNLSHNRASFTQNINDLGEFAVTTYEKGRNRGCYPARVGADGILAWTGTQQGCYTHGINNSGDVVFSDSDDGVTEDFYWLYHQQLNQNFYVKDLVTDPLFQVGRISVDGISDHDQSGLPWLAGRADGNTYGTFAHMFILSPVVNDPIPGINVDPTSGLTTTEDGGTDSFTVALTTQPTDDVTIGISSSITGEGLLEVPDPNDPGGTLLVNSYDLVFDSSNWDQPQTVTVVGQGDEVADGNDVTYTIVTDPAVSADGDYTGLDAEDVQVINLDPSSSATYAASDDENWLPIFIEDNDPEGVTHSIIDVGNFDPVYLSVNLNISHQRIGDLDMWITPPGGPPIPVENGDNDLTDLVTSTGGDWTLEVYDTRKKKTGTLLNWSIIVDY